MRFTCEKSSLVQGLNIAGRTVAQKSSLSVIEGILCQAGNKLDLTGYNMETAITYSVEADIPDPGQCILPAKLFGDIIRRLPEGPVTVVVDDNYKVSIRAGFASFTISAESAEDYPELPDVNTGKAIKIPQKELKEMITLVREHQLPALFAERSGSVSAADIIARETGAAVYNLDMAMAGEDYFQAMYHNIDTIKEALG